MSKLAVPAARIVLLLGAVLAILWVLVAYWDAQRPFPPVPVESQLDRMSGYLLALVAAGFLFMLAIRIPLRAPPVWGRMIVAGILFVLLCFLTWDLWRYFGGKAPFSAFGYAVLGHTQGASVLFMIALLLGVSLGSVVGGKPSS